MTPLGRALAVAAALPLAGCLAAPLAHPLRATNGVTGELSATAGVFSGSGRECFADGTCRTSSGKGGGVLAGSAGYSHVFAGHFGAMAGVYGPSLENEKVKSALSAVSAYSFFTYQQRILSVGAGPEMGYGGPSLTMGGELAPYGDDPSMPRFGAYARWFWPLSKPTGVETDDHRTHEFGARVRVGIVYAQYAFYQQVSGLREFTYFGTQVSARQYHQLTIGLVFDAISVPALASSGVSASRAR